jgi:hypothetical protein
MAKYTFDLRINTTITVEAKNEKRAFADASMIMDGLELIDHVNDTSLDMDLEDGLEPL